MKVKLDTISESGFTGLLDFQDRINVKITYTYCIVTLSYFLYK